MRCWAGAPDRDSRNQWAVTKHGTLRERTLPKKKKFLCPGYRVPEILSVAAPKEPRGEPVTLDPLATVESTPEARRTVLPWKGACFACEAGSLGLPGAGPGKTRSKKTVPFARPAAIFSFLPPTLATLRTSRIYFARLPQTHLSSFSFHPQISPQSFSFIFPGKHLNSQNVSSRTAEGSGHAGKLPTFFLPPGATQMPRCAGAIRRRDVIGTNFFDLRMASMINWNMAASLLFQSTG